MERATINRAFSQLRARVPITTPAWAQTLLAAMNKVEKTTLLLLLTLFLVSGAFSIFGFISRHTELIPQSGGTYREAAVGQPRNLSPILANANDLDVDITRLVYSGLFRHDGNLNLVNDLATGYETSADNTEYKISLRHDVRWHDGVPFTAEDVIFTVRSIQTKDYGSPLFNTFQGVSVDKIDDHTVLFTLTKPYAPFLHSLTVGIAPAHVWSEIAPQNATLAEQMLKPVGTGPFKFAEITTRRKTGDITTFRLIRNEDYFGQVPYLDEIIFTFYISHEEAINALLTAEADGVGFVPLQMLSEASSRSRAVHRLLLPQYFAIFFNEQDNELLSDAGVRAALALATDREAIVDQALGGQGEPLHLPIPPGAIDYDGEFLIPEVNLEAARQNLAEAGWEDTDNDGIRDKDGNRLTLTLTTTDWPDYVQTAEEIKKQWREIGVDVNLEHLGAGTIQQIVIQPRDYEALLFGHILPAEPDPYPFWHSTQTRSPGLNLSLFKNEEVDKLLEEARNSTQESEQQEKLREFQNKILELNPAVILYRPYYLFATADNVRGIELTQGALPSDRFNQIENWHVKVNRVWKNSD